jgi:hypothetical protein
MKRDVRVRACWFFRLVLLLALLASSPGSLLAAPGLMRPDNGMTYYVSNAGDDNDDGLTPDTAFATVAKVNALDLQPGDQVLFACGDVWRAEPLVISKSGTEAAPITFGSYPANCADQPLLSGAQPISGWSVHSDSIYMADLSAGDNAGKFAYGLNQLFQGGERLPFGRWPNLDTNADGGYSTVDGAPSANQLIDNDLPASDWTGAALHIKTERWMIVNREVTASGGQTLTLNDGVSCRGGCTGWGYFLNNHLATLDQEGEWYYDAGTNCVYLYSPIGPPSGIEGAAILEDAADSRLGGIMLGGSSPVSYVIVENLAVEDWFNYGISAPGSLKGDIYHHITVRDCTVKDVETAAIRLSTWIWSADNGRDGLRGGHHMTFTNNILDGANHFGLTGFFHTSTIQDNEIKNVGLVKNMGKSGMGCGFTGASCTENGDGIRIRTYLVEDSGHSNVVRYNHIERTGYNGMDVFGPDNLIEYNIIERPCYSKGDCGGVRTFGSDSLAATEVYDLAFRNNVIVDSIGNVDGVTEQYHEPFGLGLYIDNYSRDVEASGNTIVRSTVTGILYQRSTGEIHDNVVYNAASGTMYAGQISLGGAETRVTMADNVLFGLQSNAWTLYAYDLANVLSSDYNDFFQPYVAQQIAYGPSWTRYTFAQWQAFSGQEAHSQENWYTQQAGEELRSRIIYNVTKSPLTVDLGSRKYLDLDQNDVLGSVTLQPFTSIVLVDNGPAPLTLTGLSPSMIGVDEAADFTLNLFGTGFTENSVARWTGADRPTGFESSSWLTATIYVADISAVADIPVTVYDPSPAPTGTETLALLFRVVDWIARVYLPVVLK